MGRLKKICFVSDLATGGGVEHFIQMLSNEWYDRYKIYVISETKDNDFAKYYNKKICHYYRNIAPNKKFLILWRIINKCNQLKCKFVSNRCDVVFFAKVSVTTNYVVNCKAKRKIGWCHGDLFTNEDEKNAFKVNNVDKKYLKNFDNVVCVSKRVKESIISLCGDSCNLIVRYNPVNIDDILKKSKEFKVNYNFGVTTFVWVGRLGSEKGPYLLLKAVNKLQKRNYHFKIIVIGDGPERSHMEDYIKLHGLHDCITLIGEKGNPFPYMIQADWYISTSLTEGYSFSSQEAAVLGIPLIITDVSGARDLLGDNGEYGIISEIKWESIYENMKTVLDNPKLHAFYKDKINHRKKIVNYQKRLRDIEDLL